MKKYYEKHVNSNLTATLLLYSPVILITVESIKGDRRKAWLIPHRQKSQE